MAALRAGLPVKKKERKTAANWVFAQTTHVAVFEVKVCMLGGLWCEVLCIKFY